MKKCICILLALILALCASAASAESAGEGTGPESRDYEHATVGNPTKLDGCFFTGMWGNITSDVDIRDLVAGYNLVKWDGGFSQYRFDHSVVSGAVAGTDRDGNRRYEIVLCDDLYFSDGTPVTARDYAFSILLQCSPLISDLGGHPEAYPSQSDPVLAGSGGQPLQHHGQGAAGSPEYQRRSGFFRHIGAGVMFAKTRPARDRYHGK